MSRIARLNLGIFFFLSSISPILWAQEPATPSAVSILKASQKKMYAVKDQVSSLTFRIIDDKGNEHKSVHKLYWKNFSGENGINSKTLLVTESPIKNRGKKFLVWEYVEEDKADQWIYLPELRQVRRVQPERHRHHGEPESELVIEDVRQRRIEKDEHRSLPDAEVRGEPSYVIESFHQGDSPYEKTITYISKNDEALRKIEYFSEGENLLKTQWIEWEEIDGVFVWKSSEIKNARSARKSLVDLSDTKVNTDLPDDQFTERALRR